VKNLSNVTDEYKKEFVPKYYSILAEFYAEHEGPFLLGERITYPDFAIYQSIDNDLQIGTLPVHPPSYLILLFSYVLSSLTCWELSRNLFRSLSPSSEQRSKPALESPRTLRAAMFRKSECDLPLGIKPFEFCSHISIHRRAKERCKRCQHAPLP
jgi:hypothetical protein